MKGLDLARAYFEQCGKAMLETEFSKVLPFLAIGLVGSGSECYGYDDEISRDHDFEPGFCIFLPEESVVDSRTAFLLERAYAKLPKEFMGYKRSPINPVGGKRHGVICMEDFFLEKVGSADGKLSLEQWFSLPEYGLLEATNGEVFCDPFGKFSAIRERLHYLPEDVRLKKLAGRLLLMGQAGQYNYNRCVKRGETAAAQLGVFEFVQSAIHSIYLLNRKYMPYYKWSFRGLKELQFGKELAEDLEYLLTTANTEKEAIKKAEIIERVCKTFAEELRARELTQLNGAEMEVLAYSVNDKIKDGNIRTLHILQGV